MADGERNGSDVVRTLGQLIGLAAGFVALVYAAGGGVLALRLYIAHLPSRTIVGQLPRDVLISIGLAQIVLPVLAVCAVYVAYRLLRGTTPPPTRLVGQWSRRSKRDWAELFAVSAIPALGVAVIVVWRGSEELLLWLVPITFFVTWLAVLVGLNVKAKLVERYGDPETLWNTRRPILWMTLVVALVSVPICVIVAGVSFPLLDAKVCTSGSQVSGVLIGETSDRTYIGETFEVKKMETGEGSGSLLVFSIPRDEIAATFIGGDAGMRPCPAVG